MFTVLQTYFSTDDDLSNEAAGGSSSASGGRGGEGRRGAQTLLWYQVVRIINSRNIFMILQMFQNLLFLLLISDEQDYPVEPACCSIS